MRLLWRMVAGFFDVLLVPAYGAPGYRVRRRTWRDADEPRDLRGQTFLVTGGNAGIGRAAAEALARQAADVHLVCRSAERGQAARDALAAETGNSAVTLHVADMASLEDVRRLAGDFAEQVPALHGLIHNAGALLHERCLTTDGLETTFAAHVAGPFLLTTLLGGLLERSAPSRVVFVSSGGMYAQRLRVDGLERGEEPFDGVIAYAQAKRAQVILSAELARHLAERGIAVSSMHPGWADTGGVRTALPRFYRLTRRILRTPAQGADTAVWLAAAPGAAGAAGGFYLDRVRRREHLPLRGTRPSPADVQALWQLLERVCGLRSGGDASAIRRVGGA